MSINIWKLLCVIIGICLFAACKSTAGSTTTDAEIMKTEEAFFASVLERTFRFNTLSARMKLEYNDGQKDLSSRVQLKMIYNDRFQLSIQPFLGVEVFRIEVTNDSVKILDRMNKRYMIESHENIKGKTEIDFNFHNLQALLTNQIFVPGENDISMKHYRNFRMTKNNNLAKLNIKSKDGTSYTFTADADEKLLVTNLENTDNNQSIIWDYNDFQIINRQQFPMKMTARLLKDAKIQGTAILTLSSPEINAPLKTDFVIPSGYERITSEQIIKLIGKK